MKIIEDMRALGEEYLREAQKSRDNGWLELEDRYLTTAADIAGASDLELLEMCA